MKNCLENLFISFAVSSLMCAVTWLMFCFIVWDYWPDEQYTRDFAFGMIRLEFIFIFIAGYCAISSNTTKSKVEGE